MMYFDIGPKEKRKDMYNFKKEYQEFKSALFSHNKLIVLRGLRRTGKTTFMNVAYNELKAPKIYIDAREIGIFTQKAVYIYFSKIISDFIRQKNMLKKAFNLIESIDLGVRIGLNKEKPLLSMLLKEIDRDMGKNKKIFYIFIDEAQFLKSAKFDVFLAFIYDKLPNVKIVLAGSEIGLLDEFIGESSDSPLYGRAKKIIPTRRLKRNESIEFLNKGFLQAKKNKTKKEIEKIVDNLDGIIGWLSLYGFYSISNEQNPLLKVKKEGAKIVCSEINRFLSLREVARESYVYILLALSTNPLPWGEIKRYIIIKEKRDVPDSRLFNYLESLEKYGFIEKYEKKYHITDPLIKEAIKLLTPR